MTKSEEKLIKEVKLQTKQIKTVRRKRLLKRIVMRFKPQRDYINDNLRVSYAFHFGELGFSYHLQRKIRGVWYKTAWTYGKLFKNRKELIDCLLWHENA